MHIVFGHCPPFRGWYMGRQEGFSVTIQRVPLHRNSRFEAILLWYVLHRYYRKIASQQLITPQLGATLDVSNQLVRLDVLGHGINRLVDLQEVEM
jgi:hypothetical protein